VSETSEQYTKRIYKNRLLGNDWQYQYSIFYQEREAALGAIENGAVLRKAIARRYRNQPFLWRLAKNLVEPFYLSDLEIDEDSDSKIVMVYWTFFTTQKIRLGELEAFVSGCIEDSVRIKIRATSKEHLEKMARTIARQKPHDLNDFFDLAKVNRMHCVNKDQFTVY
jgi:hypothetical protein